MCWRLCLGAAWRVKDLATSTLWVKWSCFQVSTMALEWLETAKPIVVVPCLQATTKLYFSALWGAGCHLDGIGVEFLICWWIVMSMLLLQKNFELVIFVRSYFWCATYVIVWSLKSKWNVLPKCCVVWLFLGVFRMKFYASKDVHLVCEWPNERPVLMFQLRVEFDIW